MGLLAPNEMGIHDLSGNVWEWCADWHGTGYYAESPTENPKGRAFGVFRSVRGGSWRSTPETCRTTTRFHYPPDYRGTDVGFRLVMTAGATPGSMD